MRGDIVGENCLRVLPNTEELEMGELCRKRAKREHVYDLLFIKKHKDVHCTDMNSHDPYQIP